MREALYRQDAPSVAYVIQGRAGVLELLRVLLLVLLQTCGYDFDCDSPRVSDGSTGGGALTFKQSSRSTQAPSTTVGMGTSRIVN